MLTSTGAMMGVSTRTSGDWSSKYSSRASARLDLASSTVSPWLATSTSKQRATYQGASWVIAAVRRMSESLGSGAEPNVCCLVGEATDLDRHLAATQRINLADHYGADEAPGFA